MTKPEQQIAIAEWVSGRTDNYAGYRSLEELEHEHNYPNDLNVMHEAFNRLSPSQKISCVNNLRLIVGRRLPKNKVGVAIVSDIDLLGAECVECSEALCQTLWPERFE